MVASAASAIGSSLASAGISKLLGGKKSSRTLDMNAGGYNIHVDKYGNPFIKTTKERTDLVNTLSSQNTARAAEVKGLIPGVQSAYKGAIAGTDSSLAGLNPGYGDVTNARVKAIQDQASKSSSDLRGDLARRRVIGSSFAGDALARDKAEFAKQEADSRAKSYLEELDAKTKLIQTKLDYQINEINDTNTLLGSAFDLSQAATTAQLKEMDSQRNALAAILGNAQGVAEMNAKADAQKAATVGSIAGNIGSLVGSGISGLSSYAGLSGGYDPISNITWNSGRVA